MRTIILALVLSVMGAHLLPLSSQVLLQGTVREDESDDVVAGAAVRLLRDNRVLSQSSSGQSGEFSFRVLPGEAYQLEVNHPGFAPVTTPTVRMSTLRVNNGDTLIIELRVSRNYHLLAPVTVTARMRGVSPMLEGFLERRERGMGGYFLTGEQIRTRGALTVTDALRGVPGVHLVSPNGSMFSEIAYLRGAASGDDCPAQIYLDGTLMNRRRMRSRMGMDSTFTTVASASAEVVDEGMGINNLISARAIEGIEIYRGLAAVPVQFMSPDSRCGVIAIWTRSGPGR